MIMMMKILNILATMSILIAIRFHTLVSCFVHRYTHGLYTVYNLLCTMQRSTSSNRLLSPLKHFQLMGSEFVFKIYEQIVKTKNNIFDEICREIHVEKHQEIRSVFLNKRNVSKESVCLWLENVCSLLEQFCIPTLYGAMAKCDEQNRKLIKSQKTIIDLQAEVIKKSDL